MNLLANPILIGWSKKVPEIHYSVTIYQACPGPQRYKDHPVQIERYSPSKSFNILYSNPFVWVGYSEKWSWFSPARWPAPLLTMCPQNSSEQTTLLSVDTSDFLLELKAGPSLRTLPPWSPLCESYSSPIPLGLRRVAPEHHSCRQKLTVWIDATAVPLPSSSRTVVCVPGV